MEFKEIIIEQIIDAINEFHRAVKHMNSLVPKTTSNNLTGDVKISQDLISLIHQARRDIDHSTQKMIDAMTYFVRIK